MIYGVVRFVDLRMLLLRPISFSSNCPFAPLTNPPNFFCTLTKFNTPLWFLRGMLTVGFLQFKVWRGIKKKRKRKSHTPSFIACGKHPHQELTRGRHLVGIKHASLIKGTWKGHSGEFNLSCICVYKSSFYPASYLFYLKPGACSLKWILRDFYNQGPSRTSKTDKRKFNKS